MKKKISHLIDELSITNIKIYHLVEKVQSGNFEKEDAQKLQDLNSYRSELTNALDREFKERETIKV